MYTVNICGHLGLIFVADFFVVMGFCGHKLLWQIAFLIDAINLPI